jgi:hypothetical protein
MSKLYTKLEQKKRQKAAERAALERSILRYLTHVATLGASATQIAERLRIPGGTVGLHAILRDMADRGLVVETPGSVWHDNAPAGSRYKPEPTITPEKKEPVMASYTDRVLEHVKANPGQSAKQITEALGLEPQQTYNALNHCCKRHDVVKNLPGSVPDPDGYYRSTYTWIEPHGGWTAGEPKPAPEPPAEPEPAPTKVEKAEKVVEELKAHRYNLISAAIEHERLARARREEAQGVLKAIAIVRDVCGIAADDDDK